MRQHAEIGGYTLIKRLGAGGMSTVFEAEDGAGNRVALKLLNLAYVADPAGRERLRREVATLQKVRGPFVAEVLDAETDEDEAFIVTELIDGPTLEQDVVDAGAYSGHDLEELARLLGEAVATVHDVGVLHRDLKPSNVMLGETGPVLIDFGIAQVVGDSRLTRTGSVAQTPGYCDPRVINGAAPDADADWWALAAVIAFAATGRPPFGSGTPQAIMRRVLEGDVDVRSLDPRLASALRAALAPRGERLSFDGLRGVIARVAEAPVPSGVDASAAVLHGAGTGSAVPADMATEIVDDVDGARGWSVAPEGAGDDAATPTQVISAGAGELGGESSAEGGAPTSIIDASAAGGFPADAHATQILEPREATGGKAAGLAPASEAFGAPEPTRIMPVEFQPTRIMPVESQPTSVLAPHATPEQVMPVSYPPAGQPLPQPLDEAPRGVRSPAPSDGQPFGAPAAYQQGAYQQGAYPNDVHPQGGYAASPGGQSVDPSATPQFPADGVVIRPLPRATSVMCAAWLAVMGVGLSWPVISAGIFVAVSLVLAVIGISYTDLLSRRVYRGRRGSDGFGVLVRLPWTLVKAVLSLVWPAVVGAAVGMGLAWMVTMVAPTQDPHLPAGIFLASATLCTWFMSTVSSVRSGARLVARAVAPTRSYRAFWVVVFLVVATYGAVYMAWGVDVTWNPLSDTYVPAVTQ